MSKQWIMIGAINGFLAVALGAFGAHLLESRLDEEYLSAFETGVQYHMMHAVALLAIGAWLREASSEQSRTRIWAPRLLLIGIVLFSGSLYVLSLSGLDMLGIITPLGGISFLSGWLCLALSAKK